MNKRDSGAAVASGQYVVPKGDEQELREIVLDTETTGLNPNEGHRVVEIGAVELIDLRQTGTVFHRLVNPERAVPEEAVRVHGHTYNGLKDKPVFRYIADELLDFVGGAQLVIHNADFDVQFLNSELERIGAKSIHLERVVDTLRIARKRHPGQNNSLDALCDRYGIDRSKRVMHGALLDAEILAEIYVELKGGRQRSLNLDDITAHSVPEDGALFPESCIIERDLRKAIITSGEAQAHSVNCLLLGRQSIWNHY